MHIETKIELVSKDGKRFSMFSDIAFSIHNEKTDCLDNVICRIIGIVELRNENNGYIIADKIEINDDKCNDNARIFYFNEMLDVHYVYCD